MILLERGLCIAVLDGTFCIEVLVYVQDVALTGLESEFAGYAQQTAARYKAGGCTAQHYLCQNAGKLTLLIEMLCTCRTKH